MQKENKYGNVELELNIRSNEPKRHIENIPANISIIHFSQVGTEHSTG